MYSIHSDLASAVQAVTRAAMDVDEDPLCLDIRRDHLLMDCMKEAKKKRFTTKKLLKARPKYSAVSNIIIFHV